MDAFCMLRLDDGSGKGGASLQDCIQAVQMVGDSCRTDEGRVLFGNGELVDHLKALLDPELKQGEGQSHYIALLHAQTARAVGNLVADNDINRQLAADRGIPDSISKCWSKWQQQQQQQQQQGQGAADLAAAMSLLRRNCAGALGNLCCDNPALVATTLKSGGALCLAQILSSELQAAAAAGGLESGAQLRVGLGAIPVIGEVDPVVVMLATNALSVLVAESKENEGLASVCKTDAMRTCAVLASLQTAGEEVVGAVVQVFETMNECEQGRRCVAEQGGVHFLLSVLAPEHTAVRSGWDQEEWLELRLQCLRSLLPHARDERHTQHVLDTVLRLAAGVDASSSGGDDGSNKGLAEEAAEACVKLSCEDFARPHLLRGVSLDALVALLASSNGKTNPASTRRRASVALALSNLANGPEAVRTLTLHPRVCFALLQLVDESGVTNNNGDIDRSQLVVANQAIAALRNMCLHPVARQPLLSLDLVPRLRALLLVPVQQSSNVLQIQNAVCSIVRSCVATPHEQCKPEQRQFAVAFTRACCDCPGLVRGISGLIRSDSRRVQWEAGRALAALLVVASLTAGPWSVWSSGQQLESSSPRLLASLLGETRSNGDGQDTVSCVAQLAGLSRSPHSLLHWEAARAMALVAGALPCPEIEGDVPEAVLNVISSMFGVADGAAAAQDKEAGQNGKQESAEVGAPQLVSSSQWLASAVSCVVGREEGSAVKVEGSEEPDAAARVEETEEAIMSSLARLLESAKRQIVDEKSDTSLALLTLKASSCALYVVSRVGAAHGSEAAAVWRDRCSADGSVTKAAAACDKAKSLAKPLAPEALLSAAAAQALKLLPKAEQQSK